MGSKTLLQQYPTVLSCGGGVPAKQVEMYNGCKMTVVVVIVIRFYCYLYKDWGNKMS